MPERKTGRRHRLPIMSASNDAAGWPRKPSLTFNRENAHLPLAGQLFNIAPVLTDQHRLAITAIRKMAVRKAQEALHQDDDQTEKRGELLRFSVSLNDCESRKSQDSDSSGR